MGFYLRKSIRVDPLRFNLSSRGVGVSAGVRGFRVGTGPRGNYVHMGAGGIYYRATIPSATPRQARRPPAQLTRQPLIGPPTSEPPSTHDPLSDIDSGDVISMTDSNSQGLLEEINSKHRVVRWWPATLAMSIGALWWISTRNLPLWVMWLVLGAGILGTIVVAMYDQLRKSVVLFYEFDTPQQNAYEALHAGVRGLGSCSAIWHVQASGAVRNRKYHAGASELLRRQSTSFTLRSPPYIKTNIPIPSVGVGTQTLYFFPDRVLVFDASRVGAVSYTDLSIRQSKTRFIEDSSAPGDATVVDHTWRFVNKSGGPDKRFKDNRQLPICLYDELQFSSGTGLNEVLQFSRSESTGAFVAAARYMAQVRIASSHEAPAASHPQPIRLPQTKTPMTPERRAELIARARAIAAERQRTTDAGEHRLE